MRPSLLVVIASLLPTALLAHAGPHDDGILAAVRHALSEPDHLIAMVAVAVAIASLLWFRVRS